MDKSQLLNKLYYDPSGFQSQQRLYKEAKKQNNAITMKDVKEWYSQNAEKQDIMAPIRLLHHMLIMNIKLIYVLLVI